MRDWAAVEAELSGALGRPVSRAGSPPAAADNYTSDVALFTALNGGRLFVKRLVDEEWAGAFRNEMIWYTEVGWHCPPHLYASDRLLVLPDLTAQGFFVPNNLLTPSLVHLALRKLAGVHGRSMRVEPKELRELGGRLEDVFTGQRNFEAMFEGSMGSAGRLLEGLGLPAAGAWLCSLTAHHLRTLLHPQDNDPFTLLLHGDYTARNLLFSREGRRVAAIDWQGARLGPAAQDLLTLLYTTGYQEEEEELSKVYHAGLVEEVGSSAPSLAALRAHLRKYRLLGLVLAVFYLPAIVFSKEVLLKVTDLPTLLSSSAQYRQWLSSYGRLIQRSLKDPATHNPNKIN